MANETIKWFITMLSELVLQCKNGVLNGQENKKIHDSRDLL